MAEIWAETKVWDGRALSLVRKQNKIGNGYADGHAPSSTGKEGNDGVKSCAKECARKLEIESHDREGDSILL